MDMDLTALLTAVSFCFGAVVTAIYLYQFVYLLLPRVKKPRAHKDPKHNRYAVLIAARNEEAVIGHLLDSIRAQDYPSQLITTFVVADNCTDSTARVAAAHGAVVYQRFNKERVGKGYALNYLIGQIRRQIGLENYDAFLVFDADNLLCPDYISQINRTCSDGYEAFCGYRNTKNYGDSWLSSGCGLLYLHESVHMNHSRMLLGTCCAVSGTGFGFTRALLERMGGWNFHTLTEDLEFGTWCAGNGITIGYCPDAMLYDEQVTSLSQSWRQRTRWAQGGLQVSWLRRKDYIRGLKMGGKAAWGCFDFATLSLWGYGLAVISALLGTVSALVNGGLLFAAASSAVSLVMTYCGLFAVGVYTTATEWKKIRASTWGKLKALLTFPLFAMTFVPIALTCVFRKFHWAPIEHKVAVSAANLMGSDPQ